MSSKSRCLSVRFSMMPAWVGVMGILALSWAGDEKALLHVNLQALANQKLAEDFHGGGAGNNLAELPRGDQVLEGARFKIGERFIRLGSTKLPDRPISISGVPVGKAFSKLYILHGTEYGAGRANDAVKDGTLIGKYRVNYADESTEEIPIVYGRDVRDWWNWDGSKPVDRGKVAWQGTNKFSRRHGVKLRLFLSTWNNPKPDKKVTSIDFSSTRSTPSAPFCVAMTCVGS